jgi:membrane fusion protein (multidrug efflux system)
LAACGNSEPPAKAPPAVAVTAVTIQPRDVPVTTIFVALTQSSQAVNIQARVSGFLEKRVYTEGSRVKAGQVLFEMDKRPFQAQVDAEAAALQRNEAALEVARANLARTKPLVELNALSQRDLDDARGQFEKSAAAVEQSKAQLYSAQLNLSYATILSPVDGVSSFSAVADGTYLDAKNSQLTTVSVLSPMWINFSLSENEMDRIRREEQAGRLKAPKDEQFTVEIVLADGRVFPHQGTIDFADPSYNPETGTFLIRAVVENPDGILRPNQYVRTRLIGATRPNAVLVPQRAVQQSAKGHFVWVVDDSGEAEIRPVVVGDWHGDSWFINEGLASGDRVVVDGALRLAPGVKLKVTDQTGAAGGSASASTAGQ